MRQAGQQRRFSARRQQEKRIGQAAVLAQHVKTASGLLSTPGRAASCHLQHRTPPSLSLRPGLTWMIMSAFFFWGSM